MGSYNLKVTVAGVVIAFLLVAHFWLRASTDSTSVITALGGLTTWQTKCAGAVQQDSGQGKVALVTGAAGFIGSHVAAHCAKLGMQVIAVDDMSGGFMSNLPTHKNVKFVRGDVKDAEFLKKLFADHKFDFVYHLAAYAAEGLSHFIRSYNYRNNLVGSVELINAAVKHQVKCFVFTSSIAVYGAGQTPMIEELTPEPEDPYGISKYAIELDLRAAKVMWDLNFMVFRPHNVYGPHQNLFDKYRNAIGIFINQVLSGKPITIFGDGEQTRAFSYIDDVAPVIARGPLVRTAYNEVFNIGADQPYSLNTLAHEVAKALGQPLNKVHLPERHEVKHAHSDHSKVRCFFKPPPPTALGPGLAKMVAWQRQEGNLMAPVEFAAVEVKENLPPSWDRPDLKEESAIVHDGRNKVKFAVLSVMSEEDSTGQRTLIRRFVKAHTCDRTMTHMFVIPKSSDNAVATEQNANKDLVVSTCLPGQTSCLLVQGLEAIVQQYTATHVVIASPLAFVNLHELCRMSDSLPPTRVLIGSHGDVKLSVEDKDQLKRAEIIPTLLTRSLDVILSYDVVSELVRMNNNLELVFNGNLDNPLALGLWVTPLQVNMIHDDRVREDSACKMSDLVVSNVEEGLWEDCAHHAQVEHKPPASIAENDVPPLEIMGFGVTFNAAGMARLLRSIDHPVRKIVVTVNFDFKPVNDALKQIMTERPQLPIVVKRPEKNVGCPGSWNSVIDEKVDGKDPEWYLVMNDDTYFVPGMLRHLVHSVNSHQKLAREQGRKEGLYKFMLSHGGSGWPAFAITSETVRTVGRFDENFYPVRCEDTDYEIRLSKAHVGMKVLRSVLIIHGNEEFESYHAGTDDILASDTTKDNPLAVQLKKESNRHDCHIPIKHKWGSEEMANAFEHPFNDSSLPVSYWKLDPERRRCVVTGEGVTEEKGTCPMYNLVK